MTRIHPINRFYLEHLPGSTPQNNMIRHPCPFCGDKKNEKKSILLVFLNPTSFFHGYFRCLNRCVPGGFPLHFARLRGIPLKEVPGFDPDRQLAGQVIDYPVKNLNDEIGKFMDRMPDELLGHFAAMGISPLVLREMQIGYNGRYLVYPHLQPDGSCYSARCVHPDRPEDTFMYGDETFFQAPLNIFNSADIERCENGAMFIVEGEDNLLALKQLGLPGIATAGAAELEKIDPARLAWIRTFFLCVNNSPESQNAARNLATRLGFRARLISWPEGVGRDYCLTELAREKGPDFGKEVFRLIKDSKSFSPFASPDREYLHFFEQLNLQSGDQYKSMLSGFAALDKAMGGIHGINIVGGMPKTGKSCFLIQVATQMALNNIPVLYYDFENGRQKIYQRTLCRLSRLSLEELQSETLDAAQQQRLALAREELKRMLPLFRIITDRQVTAEQMRRHVDFLRHETNNEYTMVVIDSLHKLPFKDFSERRTGIDAWLRQLEMIRDELNVSFLVVSELARGAEGQYDKQPHLGSFKGSGDIEYSADNALVLLPQWDPFSATPMEQRANSLWLVASRERSPGRVASYRLDYPYWGFVESSGE